MDGILKIISMGWQLRFGTNRVSPFVSETESALRNYLYSTADTTVVFDEPSLVMGSEWSHLPIQSQADMEHLLSPFGPLLWEIDAKKVHSDTIKFWDKNILKECVPQSVFATNKCEQISTVATVSQFGPKIDTQSQRANIVTLYPIFDKKRTSVFGIIEWRPSLVMRYHAWFPKSSIPGNAVDPSIKLYWVYQVLGEEITPRVLYVSPPLARTGKPDIIANKRNKVSIGKIKNMFAERSDTAKVRFLVMDKIGGGVSLSDLVGRISVTDTILHVIKVIEILRKMHEKRIIHKNVTPEHFIATSWSVSAETTGFKTIGLSSSVVYNKNEIFAKIVKCLNARNTHDTTNAGSEASWSPWELFVTCNEYSFRDDIFQALTLIPYLIYGQTYYDAMTWLRSTENSTPKGREMKETMFKTGRIFSLPYWELGTLGYQFVTGGYEGKYNASIDKLDEAMDALMKSNEVALKASLAVQLRGAFMFPDYDAIIARLREAIEPIENTTEY